MGPKYYAEVLSSIPKCKKTVVRLHVLEKLCSGMNYTFINYEVNANESALYIK